MTADVLVLVGEPDPVLTERSRGELAGLFPRGVVVVQKSAGHFPWLDDSALFTTTVATFLGQPEVELSGEGWLVQARSAPASTGACDQRFTLAAAR
ncbi:MAG: alpha/beta fold hydrolase [Solirubrobacteraceae bacterium]